MSSAIDRVGRVSSLSAGVVPAGMNGLSQRATAGERRLVTAVALYAVLIPLASFLYIDVDTRSFLLSYRQVALVGLVSLAALVRYRHGPTTTARRVALMYAPWYAAVAIPTGRFFVGVVVVYTFWAVVVFDLIPMLGTRRLLPRYLRVVVIAGTMVLLSTSLLWLLDGNPVEAQNLDRVRWSIGFENPNILSASILLVVVSAVWRYGLGYSRRAEVITLCGVGSVVAFLAASSNYFLFWFGFLAAYFLLGRFTLRLVVAAIGSAGLTLLTVLIGTESVDRFNRTSSGRIALWRRAIESLYDGGFVEGIYATFTGAQGTFAIEGNAYSVATSQFAEQRIGIDNTYLATLIESGLVGLLILVGAWVLFLRPLGGFATTPLERLVGATAVGFAIQGLVISNVPSFGNGWTLGVCCMMALAVGDLSSQRSELENRRSGPL